MQHPIHLHSFLDNFGVCVLCCSHTHSYQCQFPLNELFCDPGGSAYFLGFSLHSSAGYFSLPERLLTALGLLPMWFSLVSLFPSLCSLYHLASFYTVICRPSWLISVFWGASGDSSTHCRLFSCSPFPLLGSLKLFVLEYLSYWTPPFCLIAKFTLSTPCWLIFYFPQFFFPFCGSSLLKVP